MKKFLLTVAVMGACSLMNAAAQTPEVPDTVKIIENAGKVMVSRMGDTTTIEVEKGSDLGREVFSYKVTVEEDTDSVSDIDWELELPFGIGKDRNSGCSKLRTSVILFDLLYVGQRFNYFDKGNVKNSVEGGVRNIVGVKWSRGSYKPSFSIGLGASWQYYEAQDGFAYAKDGSNLVLVPVAEGYDIKSSLLTTYSLQVPLIYTQPIGRNVKLIIGAVGYFNSYAQAQTVVSVGKDKYKTQYRNLQQRLFTAECTCGLGVRDILGVYVSWSPMTLFQAPYGPQLKSWSIGTIINI